MTFLQEWNKGKSDLAKNKIVRLTFFSMFIAVFCLMIAAFEATATTVGEIEMSGLYSATKDELLYLLDIKPGGTIDPERVNSGIKRAFLKGIFEDITVETTEGEKANIIIHVKEKDYIKNIYIKGDYALSKSKIRGLFLLKEGDALACGMLEKAIGDLRSRIIVRGFPLVEIKAEVERLKEPTRVNITLHINAGQPEIIREISISGPAEDVRAEMKLSEGDIFDQIKFAKDIDRIKTFYKDRQHFKPFIGPHIFAGGVLSFSVNPGKRLEISIEGNDHVSTKALLKEMPFFAAEEFSDDIVEEAAQRILSVYISEGYPFAQIAHAETSQADLILLTFSVQEGKQVETGEITFSGNTLPEKSLKEIMSLKEGKKYNAGMTDTDREVLQNFYNSLGYLSAAIEEFEKKYEEGSQKMDIFVALYEGPKTVVDRVTIAGAHQVSEEELRTIIKIKPGDVYNEVDISDARYRVVELYGNKGFPEAMVSVTREIEKEKAHIVFQINENSLMRFGKVIVGGNRMTKYVVIKRELAQEEGMPFDFNLLSKERQRLYRLGLFSAVDMEVIDRHDDKKDVLMKLKEGDAGAIEFGLGYGDYERYRGMIDLSYKNLMGMNRQVSARLELSSLEKRYILQYVDPWFLEIPMPFRAYLIGEDRKELNAENREVRYHLTRHLVTAGFEKKLSETLKSALFYEFSLVNTYDVAPDVILSREDTGTLVISGLRLGFIYDTRDNPFYPQRGIFAGTSLKFTSPVFFSETDFLKLSFYGTFFHKITEGIVFAASLRGGFAQGFFETNELPIVERFFLGGSTTVRGYAQDTLGPKGSDGNPTGGNAFLMENLELRTSLGKGIGLVAFVDGGNVWQKIDEIGHTDIKFTAGLGLRYDTPVGPVRVDYGAKLQKETGESSGELHFSIGHAF